MRKVLLAYRCSDEGALNPFETVLPVGLGYIHSYLRSRELPSALANFSRMDPSEIQGILHKERPDIVGISCFTFNRSASVELARIVKSTLPDATVVMGGPHATHVAHPLMRAHPEIDVCVVGEGELTFERFVRTTSDGGTPEGIRGLVLRRRGELLTTPAADPIADLDALPFPALHPDGYGVEPRVQYPYVVTSRGCPAKCSFCSSPEFWGSGVRFRSARNILDELQLLRERFGLLYVSFRDDIFALHKSRILELCRGMVERRLGLLWDCQTRVNTIDEERLVWMKRAGAMIVQYGIESGSPRILDKLQKGQTVAQIEKAAALTRKVGLVLSIYLIVGVPGEGEEDHARTEAMIRSIRPHDGIVTPLAVFPGTDLWSEYRKGSGEDDEFWENVGHDGVFLRPETATEDAILRLTSRLEEGADENAYSAQDFDSHRKTAGACYVTDLMEGESRERAGDALGARALYEALAEREPWNPWPLLRLGRLSMSEGDAAAADRWLGRAETLVPASTEVRTLRADARKARGIRGGKTRTGSSKPSSVGDPPRRMRRTARGFQSYPPPRDAGAR